MKYVYLTISLLLTLFAFLMSSASGELSGDISSSFSLTIYQVIIEPIRFFNLSFDTFHTIIRKLAHITEYLLMGYFWMVTFYQFKIKIGYVFALGLIIASLDEMIQLFSVDRGPSIIDVLLYDYLSFFVGALFSTKYNHISILSK
ncbi:MAG: VanZ family protein [Candidatus Izemoplasmatales bacterium]